MNAKNVHFLEFIFRACQVYVNEHLFHDTSGRKHHQLLEPKRFAARSSCCEPCSTTEKMFLVQLFARRRIQPSHEELQAPKRAPVPLQQLSMTPCHTQHDEDRRVVWNKPEQCNIWNPGLPTSMCSMVTAEAHASHIRAKGNRRTFMM